MKATPSEINKYLVRLSKTPQRIGQMIEDMDQARLQQRIDAKSWSANDILAHLRSCADLWTHSMYAMLAENEPQFSDIDERKWTKITRYAELPFEESFQAFVLQRKNLLRVLQVLPFKSWERSAIIFGRKHTVFTQTRRMAKHEAEHMEQLESLLAELARTPDRQR
jgi:uncharacterized damage-inducible protein DinB